MKRVNFALGLSVVLILISLFAWGYQLKNGLVVTDMRNSFSWGLYIATFAFFVGIAAGGLIVSSSVYLFNIRVLKPFTRLASLTAFASIVGAAIIILPDIGRVERVYNLILHPNFRSPLIWDVIVISFYLVLTFLSVYFQLLPDWKREGRGFLNGWTKNYSGEQVEEISHRWSRRVALIGLPVAILIHTVTALIFAVQASRSWWHTPVLPPDFVAVAVASGAALVLFIALLMTGREGFDRYRPAFKTLASITAGALLVHFFLMYADILLHWWWGKHEALEVLELVFRRYGFLHFAEVILLAFVMFYFFSGAGKKSPAALLTGCVILFVGVFIHRIMLMYPAFNSFPLSINLPEMGIEGWHYPIAAGEFIPGNPVFVDFWHYVPSPVEMGVTLLPFGLAIFIISLAVKKYNFLVKKQETPSIQKDSSLNI